MNSIKQTDRIKARRGMGIIRRAIIFCRKDFPNTGQPEFTQMTSGQQKLISFYQKLMMEASETPDLFGGQKAVALIAQKMLQLINDLAKIKPETPMEVKNDPRNI